MLCDAKIDEAPNVQCIIQETNPQHPLQYNTKLDGLTGHFIKMCYIHIILMALFTDAWVFPEYCNNMSRS